MAALASDRVCVCYIDVCYASQRCLQNISVFIQIYVRDKWSKARISAIRIFGVY